VVHLLYFISLHRIVLQTLSAKIYFDSGTALVQGVISNPLQALRNPQTFGQWPFEAGKQLELWVWSSFGSGTRGWSQTLVDSSKQEPTLWSQRETFGHAVRGLDFAE
jgi:hypothetical protein